MEQFRECKICLVMRPIKCFIPSKDYPVRTCKDCMRIKLKNKVGEKYCCECGETKPLSEFALGATSHRKRCKKCTYQLHKWRAVYDQQYRDNYKGIQKESFNKHKEKRVEYRKKWAKTEKRKAYTKSYQLKCNENVKRYVQRLSDGYIRDNLKKQGLNLIPKELIELKRLQIIAKRTFKKQKHESH